MRIFIQWIVVRQYDSELNVCGAGENAVYRIGHRCSEDNDAIGYVRMLANRFYVPAPIRNGNRELELVENGFKTKEEAEKMIDRIEASR